MSRLEDRALILNENKSTHVNFTNGRHFNQIPFDDLAVYDSRLRWRVHVRNEKKLKLNTEKRKKLTNIASYFKAVTAKEASKL